MSQSFDNSPTPGRSLLRRVQQYAAALWKHAADGLRVTPAAEIARRLQICQTCPTQQFDGAGCRRCGCPVSSSENSLRNKLAMASESCPDGHWQALAAGGEFRPRLTVGMAMVDDFDGVYFTVRSLMLHHPELAGQLELLVIDNRPRLGDQGPAPELSAPGETASHRVQNLMQMVPGGRYIPWSEQQGTAAPRDQVFRQARGEIVICLDSHVLVAGGALRRTLDWLDAHPDFCGLFQGPLEYDNGSVSTHQTRTWGAGMLGQWALDPRYRGDDTPPFDIPLQGLGLFGCRRRDWLGFSPWFREFGGEEGYLHDKYRADDRPVVCLPWLRWAHRFAATGQHANYPSSMQQRILNYLHARAELDQDLDDVHTHFYGIAPHGLGRDPAEWVQLLQKCAAQRAVSHWVNEINAASDASQQDRTPAGALVGIAVGSLSHPTADRQASDRSDDNVAENLPQAKRPRPRVQR